MTFRGEEKGGAFYVDIFSWRDSSAPDEAHHTPEVMKIWERMGALVEDREGRPKMEFPHVEPVNL